MLLRQRALAKGLVPTSCLVAEFCKNGRCGACCRWPGQVKVTEREISLIAGFLGVPEMEFIQKRTRLRFDRQGLALLKKPNGECEFLEGHRCLIQEVKPQQCRDFPEVWRDGPTSACPAVAQVPK